jgi:putative transposase
MKASNLSEPQIAFALKQAEDGTPIAMFAARRNLRRDVLHWHKRYGGLMPSETKRLCQLEEENAKLKRMVADLSPAAPVRC